MTVSIDASLLVSYYTARYGGAATTSAGSGASGSSGATPPWSAATKTPPLSTLVRSVLAGGKYIDTGAQTIGAQGAATTSDAKSLFALYQGLTALQGVAEQAQTTGAGASLLKTYEASFASGLSQVQSFLSTAPLKNATVVAGTVTAAAQSKVGVKAETDTYLGGALFTGSPDAAVPSLGGDVAFSLTLTSPVGGTSQTVAFDLSELGAQTRSVNNVVAYLNGKLADAGVATRFSAVATPAQPLTVKAADGSIKTIAAPANSDSYALKLKGNSTELASFSAPAATPAVYVTQTTGSGASAGRQILKLDGDPAAQGAAPVAGTTLPAYVSAVRSTVTGPDGALYVLADVDGTTGDGQTVKGSSDVALLKYDSSGTLQYTRTLGSASSAQGFGIAVSADGTRVAVTGAVTGDLDAANTAADPTRPNTFVSVFNSEGVEQWTQTATDAAGDTPAAVTFGPDNSVYVTGRTSATLHGATAQGGQDAFLLGWSASGARTISTQFGSAGNDAGIGVVATAQGITVASVDDGHAVLRQFAAGATGDAQPSVVRDLGDLQGGSLAGLTVAADGSLVLAGATRNGALAAGAVQAPADGSTQDVFVAKLSADLSGGSDALSYWDAGADATAAAVTVSGGQVYVAGSTSGDSAGFAVAIDPATGQATWSDVVAGAGGQGVPSAIAVDASGTSILDALGLPRGDVDYSDPADLVSNTSLRPGDQFKVQVGSGPATAVTIAAGETLDSLALKINRASGFQTAATVVTVDGYRQLKVVAANSRAAVTLLGGAAGRDALAPLGLTEGTVAAAAAGSATPVVKGLGAGQTITVAKPYALGLASTLSVADATSAKQAQSALAAAIAVIKQAYSDLTTPRSTSTSSSAVPAYVTAQIANYQLALARLTGSS